MKNLIPVFNVKKAFGYTLALILSIHFAAAQERFVNALSGTQIVNNAVFTVSDDKFSLLPIAGSFLSSSESRVILEIDEDALVSKVNCNVSVSLSVKAWTSTTAFTPILTTLNLNFSSTASGSTAIDRSRCLIQEHTIN